MKWCRASEAAEKRRKALAHAERAGDRRLVQEYREDLAMHYSHGPTPLAEAVSALEAILRQTAGLVMVKARPSVRSVAWPRCKETSRAAASSSG
jgi:hypothetical protein